MGNIESRVRKLEMMRPDRPAFIVVAVDDETTEQAIEAVRQEHGDPMPSVILCDSIDVRA
jgi:hypothetical protein